jgi:flagellar biosynthesis protein FliR
MLELANSFLDYADTWIYIAFGIFLRIGVAAFFLPGIGERSIPTRLKLGIAFSLTMIIFPIVQTNISMPEDLSWLVITRFFLAETVVGLALGVAVRSMIFALQTAGTLIAQSLSLTQVFGTGITLEPEPTISTILTLSGIVLALVLGLHIKLTVTLSESYGVLPFGVFPLGQDISQWAIQAMARLFNIAVSLSLPFVVISFMYNLTLGLVNKAMPQLMVVFVGMPFITGAGLVVLLLVAPVILMAWSGDMDKTLANPFLLGR